MMHFRLSHQQHNQPLGAVYAEDEDFSMSAVRLGPVMKRIRRNAGPATRSATWPQAAGMFDEPIGRGDYKAGRGQVAHQPLLRSAAGDHRTARVGQEIVGLTSPADKPAMLGVVLRSRPDHAYRFQPGDQLAAQRPVDAAERRSAQLSTSASFCRASSIEATRWTSP